MEDDGYVSVENRESKPFKFHTLSKRRQQKGIFSCRRWHSAGELPMYGELSGYPFTHLQHKPTFISELTHFHVFPH